MAFEDIILNAVVDSLLYVINKDRLLYVIFTQKFDGTIVIFRLKAVSTIPASMFHKVPITFRN